MSDVSSEPQRRSVRRQRSIYQVHYAIKKREDEMTAKPLAVPRAPLEVQAYAQQVAGHRKTEDTKFSGLLQCNNGTILKPIIKEAQKREVDFYNRISRIRILSLLQCNNGTILKPIIKEAQKREVDFYNRISRSTVADLVELRRNVPKFFGCKKHTYNGFEQEYIILEDLTERMLEPCIMDVKIGKRTWDPLASEEKMRNEQSKYFQCKQQYGFCIPGLQVFRLGSGKLLKHGKDYGKRLRGQAVKDAIRTYLNGSDAPPCRALLLQLLARLWRVQRWARGQRELRLFGASLLLVYDASKLRLCCGDGGGAEPPVSCRPSPPPLPRRRSASLSSVSSSSFSGQLSARGPVYRKLQSVPVAPLALAQASFKPPPPLSSPWHDALHRINQNHSAEHNYEGKLCEIKMNYRAMLDQLSYDSPTPNPWGTVKLIDFAHAFFNDDDDERKPDDNFREGIDNFVQIFEDLLRETEEQVI